MPSQTKQGKQEEKKKSEGAGQITQSKWQKTSECKTNVISEYKLDFSPDDFKYLRIIFDFIIII